MVPDVVLSSWVEPLGDGRPVWTLIATRIVHPQRSVERTLGQRHAERLTSPAPPRKLVKETFPDRVAVVAELGAGSARLMDRLKDEAAGWWPDPE
jgi:hypothetical protein